MKETQTSWVSKSTRRRAGKAVCGKRGGDGMVRGVRTTAAGLLCLVAMQGLVLAPRGAAAEEETVLAESDFLWDVDGWTTRGEAENFQHGQRMIKAADAGPAAWYFVAPSKFLGAKRAAYGGKLSFRHGFFEYNRCCSRVAAPPASQPRPTLVFVPPQASLARGRVLGRGVAQPRLTSM